MGLFDTGSPSGTERALQDLRVSMAEVKGSLATLAASAEPTTKDHETRIRRIEKWVYGVPITAAATIVAFIVTNHHG
jgi:hypothetical protein